MERIDAPLSANPPTDIREMLRPIVARWWLILLLAVIAGGGTYAYYTTRHARYSASTRVFLASGATASQLLGATPAPLEASNRQILDAANLIDSTTVAASAAQLLHYTGPGLNLRRAVSATPVSNSDFVDIAGEWGSGGMAARLANDFAQAFVTQLRRQIVGQVDLSITETERELKTVRSSGALSTQAAQLTANLSQLQLLRVTAPAEIRQIDPAMVPTHPVYPRPLRSAIFALLIGALIGIVLAYLLNQLDRTLKRIEDVERAYGLPLLAAPPHSSETAAGAAGQAKLPGSLRESFRSLRTNIRLVSLDDPPKTLLVASALASEGKTTVARNLALAYCEQGVSVAIVECDLRRPALATIFGVPGGVSITQVLAGEAALEDALVEVPVEAPGLSTLARITTDPSHSQAGAAAPTLKGNSITLLFAAAGAANPEAVLEAERTRAMFAQLSERFDLVIIDSAPLLMVSDTVPLVEFADATVIVSRMSVTTKAAAGRLADLLGRIPGARVLGVVANDVVKGELYGYGYGYDYSR